METKKIPLKIVLIALPAVIFIEYGALMLPWTGRNWLAVTGVARLTQIAFLIILIKKIGNDLHTIDLEFTQWLPGLKRGMFWAAGFGFFVLLGFGIMALFGKNPLAMIHAPMPSSPLDVILYIYVGGFVGPLAEEIFFRGIIYGFFRRWGVTAAILVSSLVFLAAHGAAGFTQVVGSILFAIAYEKERNLMVPITIHVLGNTSIFLISMLQAVN